MNWNRKRVVVTGAGGFIGSHLTERLVELGSDTIALVHYKSEGSSGWLDSSSVRNHMNVIPIDINDRDSLSDVMNNVDIVFHLAALIAIPYSYRSPSSYIQTNVAGTLNVLQAARDAKVGRIVQTSSSEVYGTAINIPIDENHPLQAQSPYAASKIGADKLAESFYRSFGLPIVTIRPFNTYGPRQSARAVIPTIISQALSRSSIHLGNLNPTRDFNFVSDTVDGFLKVGSVDDIDGKVINIGTGKEISIGGLCEVILGLIGNTDLEIISDSDRIRPDSSEVDRLCADSGLARSQLGWEPKIDLEHGISKTIEWIRNDPERYQLDYYVI